MGRCRFSFWLVLACLIGDVMPQYREKNISGTETDAVQAILARYLQRRLQGSQLSTPPPPAVLFSNNNQARIRQAQQRTPSNALPRITSQKERRDDAEDYDDYEDDLEGYEDSERSRTRFDLFAEIPVAHVRHSLHSLSVSGARSIVSILDPLVRGVVDDPRVRIEGFHVVRSSDTTIGAVHQGALWFIEGRSNRKKRFGGDMEDRMSRLLVLVALLVGTMEAVPGRLNDDCPNCVDEHSSTLAASRWTMPLLKLGEKRYYLGIFFKANWYRASQYCRYHGMHLASIASQEENDRLEKHIKDFGLGHEHFWTSGTDQAEEGTFFWMANGRPITFENWNVGEPNNFRYENGEEEHCLELWNRDGKGLKWNDSPCSFETFFVCEVQ